ncbi:MAG: hypothetical protein M1823_003639 [Watsoniomyces obsoletus]|nr:MAG: hypothetical protein M1823_003639 [Watsoniomyces obsoletus]
MEIPNTGPYPPTDALKGSQHQRSTVTTGIERRTTGTRGASHPGRRPPTTLTRLRPIQRPTKVVKSTPTLPSLRTVMPRPLLPKDQAPSPIHPDKGNEGKGSKRRCVSSACVPCRKRKSKVSMDGSVDRGNDDEPVRALADLCPMECDGGTPSCSTCTAVYKTECVYDHDDGNRRKTSPRDVDMMREDGVGSPSTSVTGHRGGTPSDGASGIILHTMRSSNEADAASILQQLRSGESLEALADSLTVTGSSRPPSSSGGGGGGGGGPGRGRSLDFPSLEADMADVPGSPTVGRSGETRYFGHTSSLGLVPNEDDGPPTHSQRPTESWTRVTQDAGLVGRLLALYFCWQHPLYLLFSQDCFLHDMAQGRTKYCSPLLVNALLACSCSFSDPDDAHADPVDFPAIGDAFFAEARHLLIESEHSSLTTVQALALMSLREASCGADSSGFHYAGRCMRMAIELGLHLAFSSAAAHRLTPTEIEVRKITFWGCFTLDTVWAVSVGRISQLPRAAIRVEKPTLTDSLEQRPWRPYGGPAARYAAQLEQAGHQYGLLHQMSALSEIVNDAVYTYYAPRERFTSRKLLDLYGRYRRWYQLLPTFLELTETASPQIVYLHMFYHTVVLHLFRPLLRVDLTDSDISPREVCARAAEDVSILADRFERLYGMRRVCLLMSHCILSASTIHLLNLPSPSAARHLETAVRGLREMSVNHPFAGRCLRVVRSLAQKWRIELPAAVERAAGVEKPTTSPSTAYFPIFPIRDVQMHTTPESVTDMLPTIDGTSSAPTSSAGNLFWTPFPYQGYPLQADPEVAGPMDIAAMLDPGAAGNLYAPFNRDGFKMAVSSSPDDASLAGPSRTTADWTSFDWSQSR